MTSKWAAFWQVIIRYDANKVTPWLGARNGLGVALPIFAGVITGHVSSGLVVATGALNAAFLDSDEPYLRRSRKMLAGSLLVAVAVFGGEVSGQYPGPAVAAAGVWAFAAGLLVAVGGAAADMGLITLVTLLVYAAVPRPPERAVLAAGLAMGGGLLQTALAVAFWPMRRYVPEQRALGDFYRELARAAAAPAPATFAPPASAQSTQAQTVLASLDRDHSSEGERFRLLLSQAERVRLSLLALARLRTRMAREHDAGTQWRTVERYAVVASGVLDSIGAGLHERTPARIDAEWLCEMQSLAETLRHPSTECGSSMAAMASDARYQMDALTGQLRSALDLAAYTTPAGLIAFVRRESGRPWRLRLEGTIATLRANLSLESAACRHAVRLAACVAVGDALGRGLGLHRAYWMPMTIAIVLKPDFTATFSRGVLRLAGTLAGLALATGLFHVLPQGAGIEVVAVGLLMFAVRSFGQANYGVFVLAVTAMVVFLFALTGVTPADVAVSRGVNTLAGGIVALTAYALWPTWEKTLIPEILARQLDAYRAYFRIILQGYAHVDTSFADELDRLRLAARLARSNMEASLDRLAAEPGTSAQTLGAISGIMASSHRLVHAMMALEAGLATSHPAPPRAASRQFGNLVEVTLHSLAAALRGSPLRPEELPDLREAHHTVTQAGDPLTERYAMVNVETDRITNSLNTLSEEVLHWIGLRQRAAGSLPKL